MLKGILFALGACFVWGFTFVVPEFEASFSPIEVALGRYFVFGSLALLFLPRILQGNPKRFPPSVWAKALIFALASNLACYTCLVLGVRYATAEICALVVGVAPITIAFYGNWTRQEVRYQSLIIPSILILIGLWAINGSALVDGELPVSYELGLLCSVGTLIAWSWFVVANAAFLKAHPEITAADWTTLLGTGTFLCVVLTGIVIAMFFSEEFHLEKYTVMSDALADFILGCVILGLVCSGFGAFLWNQASYHLPVPLAGQLTVFETIFGLMFAYMIEYRMPPLEESLGIACFLFAVLYGIRTNVLEHNLATSSLSHDSQ